MIRTTEKDIKTVCIYLKSLVEEFIKSTGLFDYYEVYSTHEEEWSECGYQQKIEVNAFDDDENVIASISYSTDDITDIDSEVLDFHSTETFVTSDIEENIASVFAHKMTGIMLHV